MKFSLFSGIGLLSLAISSYAAPTASTEAVASVHKEKRAASLSQAIAITSNLYSEIKTYTSALNATSAHLSKSSTPAEKKAAKRAAGKQIEGITAAVKAATAEIKAAHRVSPALDKRQAGGPADLAQLVANILLEISGALSGIIAELGLDPLLSFLTPLLLSLSALLLSLIPVVNNLLALVAALVDGLLTGLAALLAGLLV